MKITVASSRCVEDIVLSLIVLEAKGPGGDLWKGLEQRMFDRWRMLGTLAHYLLVDNILLYKNKAGANILSVLCEVNLRCAAAALNLGRSDGIFAKP